MSDDKVAKMAEYLRKGATMLSYSCPVCNSPLFKIKGEIYCINCNKKVKIVKEGEEVSEQVAQQTQFNLLTLETTIINKIQQLNSQLEKETDYNQLERIGNLIKNWLDILEKVKRVKNI